MKRLIVVNGTMGIGKTTTCRELQKLLPRNVFLDGDWCWDMRPFTVNSETKAMVINNICYLLNSFLRCSCYENVIFCWVLDEQNIIDAILAGLQTDGVAVSLFSLIASRTSLASRLTADLDKGIRTPGIIKRSTARMEKYGRLLTIKIDTSDITAKQAAQLIVCHLESVSGGSQPGVGSVTAVQQ